MERQPMILYIDCFQKKLNNLYFKKIIYRRKKIKYNYYSIKNKANYNQNIKNHSLSNLTNFNSNLKDSIKRNHEIYYSLSNPSLTPNNKIYKKIILPYHNLQSIILIQKYIRGFLIRKKIKKKINSLKKEIFLMRTANPKRFNKKININIFDAIKANSKNQKKSIKMAYNRFNLDNTVNNSNEKQNIYKKNILLINKEDTKNISFALNKKIEVNKRKKILEIDLSNDNNLSNTNNKETNLNTIKKRESSMPETEFSISNIFNEQYPQNINSNFENETNENGDNIINNLKIDDELLNKKIFQIEENTKLNKNKKSKTFFNKNKKNIILPDIKNQCFFSSFKTKENTSDRNLNTENSSLIKNSKSSEIIINEKKKNKSKKIINKKKENNNLESDYDILIKDEYDSNNQGQKKKNNNCIKYNFNPLLNSKINLKFNKKKHSKNNKNNYHFHSAIKSDINMNNKDNIFESIKNKKNKDIASDSKSSKSSFYDKEEFIIINYDYSLNDKKKFENSLKISNVENINIKGTHKKIYDFIFTLKNFIYKIIHLYVFSLLRNLTKFETYDENENEISITDNESCNKITTGRIEKNKIIFNIAKNDLKNNKIINNNNNKIMKNNTEFLSNEVFK